jgi:hypothetical protein
MHIEVVAAFSLYEARLNVQQQVFFMQASLEQKSCLRLHQRTVIQRANPRLYDGWSTLLPI